MTIVSKAQRRLLSAKPKKNKVKQESSSPKSSVIAIDTNIFITMMRVKEDSVNNHLTDGYYQSIRDMKRLVMSRHLKCIILPTVYEELCKNINPKEMEFINNCFYVIDLSEIENFDDLTYDLALDYASYELVYNRDKKELKPDSIIAAESMCSGLSLVTGNTRDFLKYNKYSSVANKNARAKAIEHYGRKFLEKRGIKITTVTQYISPNEFLNTFKTTKFSCEHKLYKATYENIEKYINSRLIVNDSENTI